MVLAEVPSVAGHPVVLVVVMRGSLVRRRGMRDGDGVQAYDGESDADQHLRREDGAEHCVYHDKPPSPDFGCRPPGLDRGNMNPCSTNDNSALRHWIYASSGAMRDGPGEPPLGEAGDRGCLPPVKAQAATLDRRRRGANGHGKVVLGRRVPQRTINCRLCGLWTEGFEPRGTSRCASGEPLAIGRDNGLWQLHRRPHRHILRIRAPTSMRI